MGWWLFIACTKASRGSMFLTVPLDTAKLILQKHSLGCICCHCYEYCRLQRYYMTTASAAVHCASLRSCWRGSRVCQQQTLSPAAAEDNCRRYTGIIDRLRYSAACDDGGNDGEKLVWTIRQFLGPGATHLSPCLPCSELGRAALRRVTLQSF